MDVKLSPELEQKILERVGDGYEFASDVVEVALRAFFGPETLSDSERKELNRCIDEALAEVERGEAIDGPEAMRQMQQQLLSRRPA